MTNMPEIVLAETWQQDRDELLRAEKEATRALDAIAARPGGSRCSSSPDKYVFRVASRPKTLLDLFERTGKLVVLPVHGQRTRRLLPGLHTNSPATSPSLAELANTGVSWATVSNMPLAQIEPYKQRMGWTMPFVSSHGTTFADDLRSQVAVSY